VVIDVLKCPWCVFRDEALAKRFSRELDRAYKSSAETEIAFSLCTTIKSYLHLRRRNQ